MPLVAWAFLPLGCRLFAIALVETIDASGSVHELLLSGEERVASRTDFHVQVALLGGARLERLAASAGNSDFDVFRVNSRFHYLSTLSKQPQAAFSNKT